jgi:hypothetical protein
MPVRYKVTPPTVVLRMPSLPNTRIHLDVQARSTMMAPTPAPRTKLRKARFLAGLGYLSSMTGAGNALKLFSDMLMKPPAMRK